MRTDFDVEEMTLHPLVESQKLLMELSDKLGGENYVITWEVEPSDDYREYGFYITPQTIGGIDIDDFCEQFDESDLRSSAEFGHIVDLQQYISDVITEEPVREGDQIVTLTTTEGFPFNLTFKADVSEGCTYIFTEELLPDGTIGESVLTRLTQADVITSLSDLLSLVQTYGRPFVKRAKE